MEKTSLSAQFEKKAAAGNKSHMYGGLGSHTSHFFVLISSLSNQQEDLFQVRVVLLILDTSGRGV